MPRVVIPDTHHPSLQFRYQVLSSKIPGSAIYARSAQQPGFDNAPVNVEHINGYFKVKGKTRWNDITLTCYNFEGITAKELWDYMNGSHQNVTSADDQYAPTYKHDMTINILDPHGTTPVATWSLKGAFFSSVSWGDMDWGTDDVIQAEVVISYDWCDKTL